MGLHRPVETAPFFGRLIGDTAPGYHASCGTKDPMMLSLESPEWASLYHAYGPASDIPRLLRQLDTLPIADGDAEPWFSIWSALAHQGDVIRLRSQPCRTWFEFSLPHRQWRLL